jgi:hypothetical protein
MMIARIWKGQAAHETPKLKRNSNKADVGTISGEESLVSYPLWGETHLLHISNIMLFLSVDRSLSLSIIQFFSSTVVCRCSRISSRLMWRWMIWTHGAHFQLCCVEWVGQWCEKSFLRNCNPICHFSGGCHLFLQVSVLSGATFWIFQVDASGGGADCL